MHMLKYLPPRLTMHCVHLGERCYRFVMSVSWDRLSHIYSSRIPFTSVTYICKILCRIQKWIKKYVLSISKNEKSTLFDAKSALLVTPNFSSKNEGGAIFMWCHSNTHNCQTLMKSCHHACLTMISWLRKFEVFRQRVSFHYGLTGHIVYLYCRTV